MSFFAVQSLTAGYGESKILQEVSFSVERGRLLGVLGANGSGKTTLLKAVCGILSHTGACILDGKRLDALSPRQLAQLCSYIPQRSGVTIDLSALDVVLMGFYARLGLLARPTAAMRKAAQNALQQVGLGDRAEENYQTLSEGQKQLCILARAMVADRTLLLLDEPESALDFRFRYEMLGHIRAWLETGDRCGIVTLHDPMLALNFCDELLVLSGGQVRGMLCPQTDSLERMETLLTEIYGEVSLMRCRNRSGQTHLVMLKE